MMNIIKSLLADKGDMTGLQLVSATGKNARELIAVLRDAVSVGELSERNGFYSIPRTKIPGPHRRSFRWVEGTDVPQWVVHLSTGPRTCETVLVLVEVDHKKQMRGWPQFLTALIDVRLGHFECCSTRQVITPHVVRYLPVDSMGAQ
ncbi:TPA: hypothetical protein QH731_003560 [Klebsiella variicola]|nr:hypothetical protein [Klebsiella variicola]